MKRIPKPKLSKLKIDYKKAVNSYIIIFCKKYELDYENLEWVNDSMVYIADMYISVDNLREDVNENYDFFFEWYWAGVDYFTLNNTKTIINQKSWAKGLRYENL